MQQDESMSRSLVGSCTAEGSTTTSSGVPSSLLVVNRATGNTQTAASLLYGDVWVLLLSLVKEESWSFDDRDW